MTHREKQRSLKEIIWQLYKLSQIELHLSDKKEQFFLLELELEKTLTLSDDMEWVDFIRLKDARTLFAMSFAVWGAQLEDIIYDVKTKPYYKNMIASHKGVINFVSDNIFSKVFIDRFSKSGEIQLGDYRIIILKKKIESFNDIVTDSRLYKENNEGIYILYHPLHNPLGNFRRRDGNYILDVIIQRNK